MAADGGDFGLYSAFESDIFDSDMKPIYEHGCNIYCSCHRQSQCYWMIGQTWGNTLWSIKDYINTRKIKFTYCLNMKR